MVLMDYSKGDAMKFIFISLLAFLGIFIFLNLTYIPANLPATLVFIDSAYEDYPERNVTVELTANETEEIVKIFNHKFLYSDFLFGDGVYGWNDNIWYKENVSIRFGGMTFCPSCDKSPIIKFVNKNKYFNISEDERQTIEKIFRKYGGRFPVL